jgi:DeoR/GlpR family transcriptional regulator of sugar metabolism
VAARFRSGEVIGLDAGSTNVEVARQIPQTLEITIVTNNPAAATALADHRSVSVILLGGNVDLRWMATTGAETVDGWRSYRLDLAVLGACAFDPTAGASTRSQHEVATKRAMIAAAAETVLPISTEKLGTSAPFHVVDTDDVHALFVESSADKALIKRCRAAGVAVTRT